MGCPRFILTPEQLSQQPVVLSGPDARHCQTLRLKINDVVCVSDGQTKEYSARIIRFLKHGVELEVVEALERDPESGLTVTLYQGFAKGGKLDLVIQKATELGLTRLVPVITAYSQMKYKSEREHRLDRWQEIARQATRQSGRIKLPEINAPLTFEQSLEEAASHDVCLILNEHGTDKEYWHQQVQATVKPRSVAVWVGPEGGFSEHELVLAARHRLIPLYLGPRILRSETAGIAAVAVIQFAWGDIGGFAIRE